MEKPFDCVLFLLFSFLRASSHSNFSMGWSNGAHYYQHCRRRLLGRLFLKQLNLYHRHPNDFHFVGKMKYYFFLFNTHICIHVGKPSISDWHNKSSHHLFENQILAHSSATPGVNIIF